MHIWHQGRVSTIGVVPGKVVVVLNAKKSALGTHLRQQPGKVRLGPLLFVFAPHHRLKLRHRLAFGPTLVVTGKRPKAKVHVNLVPQQNQIVRVSDGNRVPRHLWHMRLVTGTRGKGDFGGWHGASGSASEVNVSRYGKASHLFHL